MGYLNEEAAKTFKKVSGRTQVPPWFLPAAIPVAVIVLGVFLYGILSNNNDETPQATGPTVDSSIGSPSDPNDPLPTDEPAAPGDTDPAVSPSDPGVEEPFTPPVDNVDPSAEETVPPEVLAEEKVTVETLGGVATTVPKGAYDQAQLAALALFSGNFSGVNLPAGSNTPEVIPSAGATISSIRLNEATAAVVTFTIQVDANGAGDLRTIDVMVSPEDNMWVYYPLAF